MICESCKAGQHEKCTRGDCQCPDRREQEAVERRLKAIRFVDERLAGAVYTALFFGGSNEARILTDGAGSEVVKQFVQQIVGTLRSMNC